MPSFQGVLAEGDIDNVVAYLRTWGAPRGPERGRGQVEPPPLGDDFILNPHGKNPEFVLKGGRYVPNAEVKKALDAGERMVIIDARATSDWFGTRVPGSISVPYYGFDRLDAMPRDGTWILAYCACPHHASGVVVDELRKRGFKNTAILDEGIMAWKKSGYPLEGDTIDLAEQKKAAGIP
jgi:rhodanese-related sulfurtransferase